MPNPISSFVLGALPTVPPSTTGALPLALALLSGCGGTGEVEPPATNAAAPVNQLVHAEVSAPVALPADPVHAAAASERTDINLSDYVPNTATTFVEFESLEALEDSVLRFRSEGGMDGLVEWEPMDMLAPFIGAGVDVQKMSTEHPFALAIAPLPRTGEQTTVLILPAVDETPLVRSIAAMTAEQLTATRREGDYIIIQHEDLDARPDAYGAAEVTEQLPPGFIRGRMDTGDLVEVLGPYLNSAVDQINEQYRIARPYLGGSEINQINADDLLESLEGANQVAFGLDLDADRVVVHARLESLGTDADHQAPRPKVPTRVLRALSRHVYGSDAFTRVVAFEPEEVLDRLEDAWDVISGSQVIHGRGSRGGSRSPAVFSVDSTTRDAMQASILEMLCSFEDAATVSFGLEPGDAYAAVYLLSADPARTREAISLMLAKCDLESWGFEMALPVRSVVEGTLVEDYSVRFDTRRIDFDGRAAMREAFKTYLGDSKLHLKVATSGDHVLLLLGGDTLGTTKRIRDFDGESPVDSRIAEAAGLVEDHEGAQVHYSDAIQLIADIASLRSIHINDAPPVSIRELRRQAEDDPAQITVWNAIDGDGEVFGASFELSGLRSAVEAIKYSGL